MWPLLQGCSSRWPYSPLMSWEMLCGTCSIRVYVGAARRGCRYTRIPPKSALGSIDKRHRVYGTREVRHAFTEDNGSVCSDARSDLRMPESHGARRKHRRGEQSRVGQVLYASRRGQIYCSRREKCLNPCQKRGSRTWWQRPPDGFDQQGRQLYYRSLWQDLRVYAKTVSTSDRRYVAYPSASSSMRANSSGWRTVWLSRSRSPLLRKLRVA